MVQCGLMWVWEAIWRGRWVGREGDEGDEREEVEKEEEEEGRRRGGCRTVCGAMRVYLPREIATVGLEEVVVEVAGGAVGLVVVLEEAAVVVMVGCGVEEVVVLATTVVEEDRTKSPRRVAWAWMTVRPARMMFWVPWIWERREILLPVSVEMYSLLGGRGGAGAWGVDVVVVVGGGLGSRLGGMVGASGGLTGFG